MTYRSFKRDFEKMAVSLENHRAIIDAKTGRVWSYSALYQAVLGMAAILHQHGVRPRKRVFSILPNSLEQIIAFLGTWFLGADFCPISPLSTIDEACRFLDLSRCVAGLIPHTIRPDFGKQMAGGSIIKRNLITLKLDGEISKFTEYSFSNPLSLSADTGQLVVFTSGTVSNPKALLINGDRLWSSAVAWKDFHDILDENSRFYNILPMSYLGGLYNLGLIPFACGGSFVLSDSFSALTALNFWREVENNGVNVLWLAPTILRALLKLYRKEASWESSGSRVKIGFLGMAPATTTEKKQFEATFGFPLLENFALSETTFLTTEELKSSKARCEGSAGQILPWVDLRLGKRHGSDGPMEIEVKTPFLFEGYLNAQGEVEQPLTDDGFFRTGDLGQLTEDGNLKICGRNKDIIKKGGYLVLLSELEEVASSHPAVLECAALGVPDDFYGEVPILLTKLSVSNTELEKTLSEIAALLKQRLSKYKWPSQIIAVSVLPKTESGKIERRILPSMVSSHDRTLTSFSLK